MGRIRTAMTVCDSNHKRQQALRKNSEVTVRKVLSPKYNIKSDLFDNFHSLELSHSTQLLITHKFESIVSINTVALDI